MVIVDDEVDILKVLEKGLKKQGLDIIAFSSPIDALQYLKKSDNIKLLITDARMAEMSGFKLARLVHELKPDLRIIMMSAFEILKDEFDRVLPSTHIDRFLTKPFHETELLEAIKSVD